MEQPTAEDIAKIATIPSLRSLCLKIDREVWAKVESGQATNSWGRERTGLLILEFLKEFESAAVAQCKEDQNRLQEKPIGYIIMRNFTVKIGEPNVNGTKWRDLQSGFRLDFMKRKIYEEKRIAEEAVDQLKKQTPNDEFEVHPVYMPLSNPSTTNS